MFRASTRSVLIVDHHRDTREMYACALLEAGYEVVEACDGADAIVAATGHLPDVVVSDIRMPGPVNAVDLCRHFTRLGVKVIVMTGIGPGEEQRAVQAAGCTVLAMKPLPPDMLSDFVAQIVQPIRSDYRPSG